MVIFMRSGKHCWVDGLGPTFVGEKRWRGGEGEPEGKWGRIPERGRRSSPGYFVEFGAIL